MAVQRDRPYAGMNFHVDLGLGDGPDAGVSEVLFPAARLQLNEYRNGNDKVPEAIKLSTLTHYDNLVLRRGVIGSLAWYQWWNEARNGGDHHELERLHNRLRGDINSRYLELGDLLEVVRRTDVALREAHAGLRPLGERIGHRSAEGTGSTDDDSDAVFQRKKTF